MQSQAFQKRKISCVLTAGEETYFEERESERASAAGALGGGSGNAVPLRTPQLSPWKGSEDTPQKY